MTLFTKIAFFLLRNTFRKEIAIVLALKFVALFLLWGLFFSHKENITPMKVAAYFIEHKNTSTN